MSTERVVTNRVRWETDRASLNTTLQGAQAITDAQLETAAANDKLAQSSKIADQIFGRLSKQSQSLADSYTEVGEAARKAADAQNDFPDRISSGGGGAGGDADIVGRADTAFSALGGLAGALDSASAEALMFGSDILGSIDAIGTLRTSITALEVSSIAASGKAGVLGAALGSGLGLASVIALAAGATLAAATLISQYTEVMNEQANVLRGTLEAQAKVTRRVAEGLTTEEAQARADELQKLIAAEETNLARAQSAYTQLNDGLEDSFGALGGVVGAGLRVFDTREEELANAITKSEDELSSLTSEYEALRGVLRDSVTASNDAAEAERVLTQGRITLARDLAVAEQRRNELLRSGTLQSINDEIAHRRDAIAAIDIELVELEKLDQTNEDVIARIDELNAARGDESSALQMLVNDIQPVIAAREAESAALKQQIGDIQAATDNELERGRIIKDLTTEQRIAGQEQAQAQIEALRKQRAALMELDQSSEEVQGALAEVNAKLKEAEGDFKFYAGAAARGAAATNELQAAEDERAQKTLATNEKLASDIDRIEAQAADKRRDMQRKLADDLVDLATDIARDTEDAFRGLQQDRQDLARDLNRDFAASEQDAAFERLDAQVEIQREEARAFREHANKLQDLRRQQQFEELDLIANRDFAALFRSRRQSALQEQTLGIEAQRAQGERQTAANEQLQDIARNAERERQARLVQYEQQLQDTQVAFDRERETIEINRRRALEDLRINYRREEQLLVEKTQREIQIRNSAAQQELQLINQVAQQRIQLQQQANQSILQQFASFFPALQGLANRAQQIFNQNQISTNITMQSQVSPIDVGRAVGAFVSRVIG